MRSCIGLKFTITLAIPLLLAATTPLMAQTGLNSTGSRSAETGDEAPEWRTWTSQEGTEIEAYLKEVKPEGIVIVRRDGLEFTAPLARFSEEDRAYVIEWLQEESPSVGDFRATDFENADLPQSHSIEGVENVRPRSGEPEETGAIQTVLQFHGVPFGPDLIERIAARKPADDEAIAPRDLTNVLANLPLDVEVISEEARRDGTWAGDINAIRTAVTWDLPVLLAYRPLFEPETPESMVIVTGFDRRNLNILEPNGARSPTRLDLRNLEDQFIYAAIIFRQPTADAGPSSPDLAAPSTAFLSKISTAILEAPSYEPVALAEFLQEQEIPTTIRDINRSDLSNQMGQTKSFARATGLALIDASMSQGHVVVVPLELDQGQAFALLYERTEDEFLGVQFLPDRTFRRGPIPRSDIANQWLTREGRTYRLDLIEITVPQG